MRVKGAKRCGHCGLYKNFSEFCKRRTSEDGLNHMCKDCGREIGKKWYARVKDLPEFKAANIKHVREWEKANREYVNSRARERYNAFPEVRARHTKVCRRYQEQNKEKCNLYRREHERLPEVRAKHIAKNRIRNEMLKKADGVFTEDDWLKIIENQQDLCAICHEKKKLTKDHIIPISRGGTNWPENLQGLCGSCNSRKGNKIICANLPIPLP